uniref:Uncharacterized protein n=1 Tax=Parascaris equorum TaxID=6256 RepID=A0A914R1Z6_PAREQ
MIILQNMSIYTEKHILAFALRDRLVCLGCITDIGAASPLFKSPAVTSAAACTQSPLEKSSINDEAQHTPSTVSQNRRSRFLPCASWSFLCSGGGSSKEGSGGSCSSSSKATFCCKDAFTNFIEATASILTCLCFGVRNIVSGAAKASFNRYCKHQTLKDWFYCICEYA